MSLWAAVTSTLALSSRASVGLGPVIALGLVLAVLSWGRGIGSATGLYFLEALIFANVPAFLWLGLYGLKLAEWASEQSAAGRPD